MIRIVFRFLGVHSKHGKALEEIIWHYSKSQVYHLLVPTSKVIQRQARLNVRRVSMLRLVLALIFCILERQFAKCITAHKFWFVRKIFSHENPLRGCKGSERYPKSLLGLKKSSTFFLIWPSFASFTLEWNFASVIPLWLACKLFWWIPKPVLTIQNGFPGDFLRPKKFLITH